MDKINYCTQCGTKFKYVSSDKVCSICGCILRTKIELGNIVETVCKGYTKAADTARVYRSRRNMILEKKAAVFNVKV